MKRARFWLVAPAALLVASCRWILGLEEPAGVDRPADASTTAVDPCQHVGVPPPPKTDDAPDPAAQHDYWLGIQTLSFPAALAEAGIDRGVDLDMSCTCQQDLFDGAPPCNTPGLDGGRFCDEPGGVDDALGTVLESYQSVVPNLDLGSNASNEIANGLHTFLLYVAGYNGQANDAHVRLAIAPAGGLFTNLGCDGQARDAGLSHSFPDAGAQGLRYAPSWDGCDRWTPTAEGQVIGNYPTRSALNVKDAYVTDYTLVAPFDTSGAVIEVFGGALSFRTGFSVMKLAPEGKGFRGEGFFAGRVPFAEVIDLIGRATVESSGVEGGTPLCQSPYRSLVPQALCAARDTMVAVASDRTGQTCDGMTGVAAFVARPVEVADGQYSPPIAQIECPAQGDVCVSP